MSVTEKGLHNINKQCCQTFRGTASHTQTESEWYINQKFRQYPHAEPDEIWKWFQSSGCKILGMQRLVWLDKYP